MHLSFSPKLNNEVCIKFCFKLGKIFQETFFTVVIMSCWITAFQIRKHIYQKLSQIWIILHINRLQSYGIIVRKLRLPNHCWSVQFLLSAPHCWLCAQLIKGQNYNQTNNVWVNTRYSLDLVPPDIFALRVEVHPKKVFDFRLIKKCVWDLFPIPQNDFQNEFRTMKIAENIVSTRPSCQWGLLIAVLYRGVRYPLLKKSILWLILNCIQCDTPVLEL